MPRECSTPDGIDDRDGVLWGDEGDVSERCSTPDGIDDRDGSRDPMSRV